MEGLGLDRNCILTHNLPKDVILGWKLPGVALMRLPRLEVLDGTTIGTSNYLSFVRGDDVPYDDVSQGVILFVQGKLVEPQYRIVDTTA